MPVYDPAIVDVLEQMLRAHCTTETVQSAEQNWPGALWELLDEAGMSSAWAPERFGGAGASWGDGLAIIRTGARFAAPVPLAETLFATRVLSQLNLPFPAGALGVALPVSHDSVELNRDSTLQGRIPGVAFARQSQVILIPVNRDGAHHLCLVERTDVEVECDVSLAGEPRDTVILSKVTPTAIEPAGVWTREHLLRLGATIRCFQIFGALEHLLSLSIGYAKDRRQFARPIAGFQAVQHNLAMLAGEVAAAGAGANAAADGIELHGIESDRALLAVSSAKVRCGQAAAQGAAIAHQVHGAIGFAREYELHLYTRRLWSWRDDYATETEWAEILGRHVLDRGADNFWSLLTDT